MTAAKRREAIAARLRQADAPQSASALAAHFSVSRQLIVGDIALLRAGGMQILATPRGYVLEKAAPGTVERSIVCIHGNDRMAEELYCIVDLGGAILDVTVEHSVYGQLCASLHIFSRYDVDLFLENIRAGEARPLCDLTGGVHLHRLQCPSEAVYARIVQALSQAGLLLER